MAEAFPFVQVNLSNGDRGMSAELGGKPQGVVSEPGLFDSLVAEYSAQGESTEETAADYPALAHICSILRGQAQGQPAVFSQPVLNLLASMKEGGMDGLQAESQEDLLDGLAVDRFAGLLNEESLDKLDSLLSQIKTQMTDQRTFDGPALSALRDKILRVVQDISAELDPKATEGLKRQLMGFLAEAAAGGDVDVPELPPMPMRPMEEKGMDASFSMTVPRNVRPLAGEDVEEEKGLTDEEDEPTEGLLPEGMDRMASFAVPLMAAPMEGSQEIVDEPSGPVAGMVEDAGPERPDIAAHAAQQGGQRVQPRQERPQTPSVTEGAAEDASDEGQPLGRAQGTPLSEERPAATGMGREDANLGRQPEGENSRGAGTEDAGARGNSDRRRATAPVIEDSQDMGDDRPAAPTGRPENARADFQSFFEGVLNNRRTFSTEAAAPMSLRPGAAAYDYDFTQAETLRDGLVNVVRFVRADGAQRANVIVDPPAIGRVTVELTTSTSGVEASIKVASEQVRQLVQEQITELRMTLAQQGVQVTQFAVDVQQDDGRRQQGSEQEERRRRGGRRVGRVEEAEDAPMEFRVDLEQGLLHWVA